MTVFALAFYFKYQNKYQSVIKTNSKERLTAYKITEREQEIVACIIDGLSNKEIAKTLIIEESTVKTHVSRVYRKLEVTSRAQLMSKLTQDIDI
jgi:DNA-binding NarL/FixJ family response regulator